MTSSATLTPTGRRSPRGAPTGGKADLARRTVVGGVGLLPALIACLFGVLICVLDAEAIAGA